MPIYKCDAHESHFKKKEEKSGGTFKITLPARWTIYLYLHPIIFSVSRHICESSTIHIWLKLFEQKGKQSERERDKEPDHIQTEKRQLINFCFSNSFLLLSFALDFIFIFGPNFFHRFLFVLFFWSLQQLEAHHSSSSTITTTTTRKR